MALAVFASGVDGEPEFVDEWAITAQAYFLDLLARPDDPGWLEYQALDHPPLPKYLIGLALRLAGYPLPGRDAIRRWYADTSSTCGPHALLVVARWPSVLFGAFGCVAAYALGSIAVDRRVGVLAALLLIADPLYRMHTHRAMADAETEALVLAATAQGLWSWRGLLVRRLRPVVAMAAALGTGALGGLAVLAKLNGALALMVLAAWAAVTPVLPGVPGRLKGVSLLACGLAVLTAFGLFVGLYPLLWSNPTTRVPGQLPELVRGGFGERCRAIIRHRIEVSRDGPRRFPDNALATPSEKLKAVVVQGFGRFGPLGCKRFIPEARRRDRARQRWDFDSTIRYDWHQDLGAVAWFPLVLAGAGVLVIRGRRQLRDGLPPTAWALGVQAAVTGAAVVAFIPMAWDRYFLPLQPIACLLGAVALVAAWDAGPGAGGVSR